MNGYQIDSIRNSLAEVNIHFMDVSKNDRIPSKLQLKINGFNIVNTSVKISYMKHWILYYIKDGVLHFLTLSDNFSLHMDDIK